MFRKIYFDANILADTVDSRRKEHLYSVRAVRHCMESDIDILTSCDIVTTLYYINAKYDKAGALQNIVRLSTFSTIVDFSNREVVSACILMLEDPDYVDFEDTLQYILARKSGCDLILSNDTGFVSKEIEVMTSRVFCEKAGLL